MTTYPVPTDLDRDPQPDAEQAPQLYLHDKRPAWGLAIRIRERDGRRDYQFQDGTMRAIGLAHEHLLVAVDRPADETASALRDLAAMSGLTLARREQASGAQAGRLISFDEQVALFVEAYPDGFEDQRWRSKIRGSGQRRRSKGHRESAIAHAQELLSAEEIDRLQAQLRPDDVVTRALEVMAATSLVSAAQARPLSELPREHHRWFAEALRELLYGTGELALRFTRFAQVFRHGDTKLSWPVATVLLALVRPTEHVCVHPGTFIEQAAWMAPTLRLSKQPRAKAYERVCKMVLAVRDELAQRGFLARDLMDVYDFIWCTLRPAARKQILALPPLPRESHVGLVAGEDEEPALGTGTDGA